MFQPDRRPSATNKTALWLLYKPEGKTHHYQAASLERRGTYFIFPQAGLLACGSKLTNTFPCLTAQWLSVGSLPAHSGATAPDSRYWIAHRLPYIHDT